jgi:Saxitoxin biosynthesis operon protein SxtJ
MRTFADLKQQPSAADLRGFRLILSIGGLALALVLYFLKHRHGAAVGLVSGAFTLTLLSFVPGLGRWLFAGWMGLGLAMGRVTTPILLGLVWLILFAPLGMVFRLLRRDAMRRRFPASDATFWEPHASDRKIDSYFQQF